MMKKLSFIWLIPALLLAAAPLRPEPGFGPWNADVITGDETVLQSPGTGEHAGHHHGSGMAAYNGMQAGALALIRVFQVVISPQDGPSCRYRPVCSAYGFQAVQRYGALLGAMMAGDRILRCNPYNQPGDDPVPRSLSGE